MRKRKTKEPQNQIQYDTYKKRGPVQMGPWTSHIWRNDPKHLGFLLARYKFCGKMLTGKKVALEVGCGDAFGTQIVLQMVESVHGIDFDPLLIEDAKMRLATEGMERFTLSVHDITKKPLNHKFDAVYSLDVIEHIPKKLEDNFMTNICKSLGNHGVCIIGTPNTTSHRYASEYAKKGHINRKSYRDFQRLLSKYFQNVFLFSMNDEVVHAGYYPMAHYLLGVGVGVKT